MMTEGMTTRDAVLLSLSIVALGVSAFFLTRAEGSGEGLERRTYWLCVNPEAPAGVLTSARTPENGAASSAEGGSRCDRAFSLTLGEIASTRSHPETGLPACPACGSFAVRKAYPCPACGEHLTLIAHGQLPARCESCGSTLRVRGPGARDDAACATPIPGTGEIVDPG